MKNQVPAIEFCNISFGYRSDCTILKRINFAIEDNTYVCIIGHNGSGKSTVSKVIAGLLRPQEGEVKIYGETINGENIKYLRENVGIVFQNPDNQFVGLTVEDDMAFGLENKKVPPEEMWDIIKKTSQMIGVSDLLVYGPQNLSGGQKQKVAIASVLAMNPRIIIFDESTSMLDPQAKQELKEMMITLRDKYKKVVISITHDMEEVLNADRVILMEDGQLVKFDTPKNIFSLPQQELKNLKIDLPFSVELSHLLSEQIPNFQNQFNSTDVAKELIRCLKENKK